MEVQKEMPTLRLSSRVIKDLQHTTDYNYTTYWDADLTGFGVRVGSRTKTYIIKTRTSAGVQIKVKIGRTPPLSFASAKKKATEILAEVALGNDPRQRGSAITLREAWNEYKKVKSLSRNTLRQYTNLIENKMSDWCERRLSEISEDMVLTRFLSLPPTTANRFAVVLGAIYRFHEVEASTNIIRRRKLFHREQPRENVISLMLLGQWWRAVERQKPIYADFMKFMILTGVRISEARNLQWTQINGVIIFEVKGSKEHILPITSEVRNILNRRNRKHPLVFEKCDPRYAMQRVAKESGISFTSHTLRKTFASVAADLAPYYVVDRLLGHSANSVAGRHYVKLTADQLRRHLVKIENEILGYAGVKGDMVLTLS